MCVERILNRNCKSGKCTFHFRASFPEYLEPLDSAPVALNHIGAVSWYTRGLFFLYCQVDMFYFPFDTQTCYINITDTQTGVTLQALPVESSKYVFNQNTMWILTGKKLSQTGNSFSSTLSWELTLKRQSSYFLMTTIMPLILLSVVGLMVFPLPPDSGEKVTLSVTCLMSFFLTQLSISEHMPTSWTSMPIISKCTYVIKIILDLEVTQPTSLGQISIILISFHRNPEKS